MRNFDCAVIAIGDDLAASVLITMNLKELGAPYIVCKAHDETHRLVLEKLGADRVVIPEQEHAQRLARSMYSHNVLDYIELSEDYGILEVPAPKSWIGKCINELNVRAKLGVNHHRRGKRGQDQRFPRRGLPDSGGGRDGGSGGQLRPQQGAEAVTEQRITSRKNPLLQQVKKLLSSRKAREEARLFAADGVKLLAEAVRWYPGLDTVILSDGVHADVPESVRLFRVPEDVMASISPMESPQGALFLCRLPEKKAYAPTPGCLLLDGIQDPGNLGTILRTADALDIPVTLLEGCADPYSPKTVRASMGAVFRTQPVKADWAEVRAACGVAGIPVAVTALSQRAKDLRNADLRSMAVVIGSEGQGVRREILESADGELIIPMNKRCESLNAAVAAAIVMWQMKQ